MASTTPQKKRRLSNLFGAKKDKNKDQSPNGTPHDLHPSTSTQTQLDSAYASSAPTSSKRNSSADIVPVENNGNIDGVSPDRNLALNKNTGQVVDDDTGQVVVTTTTTTTTTMTTKPGQAGQRNTQIEVSTQKDGQPVIAEAPGDMPPTNNSASRSPVVPSGPSPSNVSNSPIGPPDLQQNNSAGPPQTYAPPRADPETFPVPARNPMREREPMDPVSPIRPNFSYPSRSDLREEPMPQQPAPKSTFGNLKAAAQGLHGVGETVRGSLNNEIDQRFPRSNSKKAAAANAKNQAVLDNGNREMSSMHMHRSQHNEIPQAPPVQSPSGRDSVPSQLMPGAPSRQSVPQQSSQQQRQSLPTPREEPDLPYGGDNGAHGFNGSGSEMSQVPSSFSPESSAPEKKQGGLRKLMKRRPVEGI